MELKVGDRVRLSEYGLGWLRVRSEGGEGEVVNVYRAIDYWCPYIYSVRWDCGKINGFTQMCLELVSDKINEEELYY